MKKMFGLLTILVIAGLVLAGCAQPTGIAFDPASRGALTWNSADKAVAVNIDAIQNTTRKNASGNKITSNAHSADFPGIYFIWDSKQKDNGYLKVAKWVFDEYENFVLTAKCSNYYWDFPIEVQDGQEMTADDCYVFYIPKMNDNVSIKNINMVFLAAVKLAIPDGPPPPITDTPDVTNQIVFFKKIVDSAGVEQPFEGKFYFELYFAGESVAVATAETDEFGKVVFEDLDADKTYTVKEVGLDLDKFKPAADKDFGTSQTFTVHSRAEAKNGFLVDPNDEYYISGKPIKAFWESQMIQQDYLAEMKDLGAEWIWNKAESWETGVTGGDIVWYAVEDFVIDGEIEGEAPFYFAADNAAVVLVNGKLAGYTTVSFAAAGVTPDASFEFNGLFSDQDFGDLVEHWSHIYKIDIAPFLICDATNQIKILAANNDACNGKYNMENNPAGLIFAGTWTVGKAGEFVNELKSAAPPPPYIYTPAKGQKIEMMGSNNDQIEVTINGVKYTLKVNGQESGVRTVNTNDGLFTVIVTINGSNEVTKLEVTPGENVKTLSVKTKSAGNGNSQ